MKLTYKPLWEQLNAKKMKRKDLIRIAGVSENLIANMGKDKPISFLNLARICEALQCTPNDVIKFMEDK